MYSGIRRRDYSLEEYRNRKGLGNEKADISWNNLILNYFGKKDLYVFMNKKFLS